MRELGTFALSKLPFLWWGTSIIKMKSYLLEVLYKVLTELCLYNRFNISQMSVLLTPRLIEIYVKNVSRALSKGPILSVSTEPIPFQCERQCLNGDNNSTSTVGYL